MTMTSWVDDKRIKFIAETMKRNGSMRRENIVSFFRFTKATASAVIKRFESAYPGAVVYDRREKRYYPGPRFAEHYGAIRSTWTEEDSEVLRFD